MKKLFYYILLKMGWNFKTNTIPVHLKKFVLIGGPHTSNWDFFPAMAGSYLLNRKPYFLVKDKLLGLPLGHFLKGFGAIGVDREHKNDDKTERYAELFDGHQEFVLMIAPEGTRKATKRWKTGFWYIAKKANVPIVLAYVDYAKKEAGFADLIYPSVLEEDMRYIMKFYQNKTGLYPDKFQLDERFI